VKKRVIEMNAGCKPLEDKELLAEVARALVDRPEQVRVTESPEGGVLVLYLYVAQKDRGKVIGRKGRTISALRNLFSAIGAMDGRQVLVKIED
jgi:predicted RNA-binding protein YlqC (UPF0109 family)